MHPPDAAALRLKAIVEADPGALIRLLQLFQIRNIVPSAVRARRLGLEYIEAEPHYLRGRASQSGAEP